MDNLYTKVFYICVLQTKLTISIVVLLFLIISLNTTIMGIAELYINELLFLNIISGVLSILLGAIDSYFKIHFFIKKPLYQLTKLANAFMSSDYTQRIQINTGDEFDKLGHVFNETAIQMEKIIIEI
ncbi:HAMP domain-containing protein [Bacillus sp. FJAT-45350]|uniref:HAMP domain-containing protein n=1 Tax=Bacillus sp. FJAT-45350 TaxID=2011014 RepID=UPI00359C5836